MKKYVRILMEMQEKCLFFKISRVLRYPGQTIYGFSKHTRILKTGFFKLIRIRGSIKRLIFKGILIYEEI